MARRASVPPCRLPHDVSDLGRGRLLLEEGEADDTAGEVVEHRAASYDILHSRRRVLDTYRVVSENSSERESTRSMRLRATGRRSGRVWPENSSAPDSGFREATIGWVAKSGIENSSPRRSTGRRGDRADGNTGGLVGFAEAVAVSARRMADLRGSVVVPQQPTEFVATSHLADGPAVWGPRSAPSQKSRPVDRG